jgi:hypothetical protein
MGMEIEKIIYPLIENIYMYIYDKIEINEFVQ